MVPANTTAYSTPGAGGQVVTSAQAGSRSTREPRLFGQYKNVVVIFQENHSFDNLYGRWGKVGRQAGQRPVAGRRGAHHPGRPERRRVRLPAAERREPHLSAARGELHRRRPRHQQCLHQQAVLDRQVHQADRHDLPAAREPDAPNGVLNGTGEVGGCTRDLVHRFYQEKYQINGGQQNRYVTGSDADRPDDGHLRHETTADLHLPAQEGLAALRHRRPVLPGRQRRLVPQPPVADRRPGARTSIRPPPCRTPSRGPVNTVLDANGMPDERTRSYNPTDRRRRSMVG